MKRSSFLLALVLLAALPLRAEDKPAPTAEEIMRLVRMSYALQEGKLTGNLRDNNSGHEEPFSLTMTQQIIRFVFNNPSQVVHLDLAAAPPLLREVKPGSAAEVPLEQYSQKVRGFDLNYEDLSLRFLYWPNPKLLLEENVAIGQKAWKVRVTSPDGRGPYGTVDVWVHQGSGGMAKMEGWDKQGNKIRSYKITSVQKVGKAHIPEEMRIESIDPSTGKRVGLTYMAFDKPDTK
jgi:hypothetical protein